MEMTHFLRKTTETGIEESIDSVSVFWDNRRTALMLASTGFSVDSALF